MRVEGTTVVELPREELWQRLTSPRLLEQAMPGVEWVDIEDDDRFTMRIAPQTALGATPFTLRWQIRGRREPEQLKLEGSGVDGEYGGRLSVELELAAAGGATEVRWQAEARFGGVLSSLGQRVLPALVSDRIDAALLGTERIIAGAP